MMLNRYISFLLSYFFIIYVSATFLGPDEESCSTPDYLPGKCIPLTSCPTLNNILRHQTVSPINRDYLLKSRCGFEDKLPKVCCALEDHSPPTDDVTRGNISAEGLVQLTVKKESLLPDLTECGKFGAFFIRGPEQEIGAFPWSALLRYETPNGPEFHCGGVLINHRYVLTAAHCVSETYFVNKRLIQSVRLGEHNINEEFDCDMPVTGSNGNAFCADPALDIPIESITKHPDFNDRDIYPDLALIRLQRNVTYTEYVRPICLEATSENLINSLISGNSAYAVGWGTNEYNVSLSKKHAMRMSIQTNTYCAENYKPIASRLRDQLCATPVSEKEQYFGDEGGALHGWNANDNYFAIGIMSFRYYIIPMENLPVVYTTVRRFIPWIIENVKP